MFSFAILFFIANTNVNAYDCPQGYFPYSVIIDYPEDNPECQYTLKFCYTCAGIGPNPFTVRNIKYWPYSGECDEDPSEDWIARKIIEILASDPCEIGDCWQNGTLTKMVFPACRKWINTVWEENGELVNLLTWEYCGEAECERVATYCVDYSVDPPVIHLQDEGEVEHNDIGDFDCDLNENMLRGDLETIWGYDLDENFTTPCFNTSECFKGE